MSNGAGLRRRTRSNAAITSATSPSPKLDSTPAMCTSASGQICWMMPVMNVPWPASKSRMPLPSSSDSSSSSMASTAGSLQPRRVQPGARQARVLDGGAAALRRAQPGVEDEDLRCACARRARAAAAATPAAAPARTSSAGAPRRSARRRSSAVNIIPPAKCASAPTGLPLTPWLPSTTWFGSATSAGAAEPVERLLHAARRCSAARRGSLGRLVRHRGCRAQDRRSRPLASRIVDATSSLVALGDRRERAPERLARRRRRRRRPSRAARARAGRRRRRPIADPAADEHLGEAAEPLGVVDERNARRCSRRASLSCARARASDGLRS